jgi:hypothetical protein
MLILQFLTSISLISLVASATTPAPEYPFRLRVWKNWKGGPPYLDAQPEIDAWGDFIVNKTQGYAGFLSVRHIPCFHQQYENMIVDKDICDRN